MDNNEQRPSAALINKEWYLAAKGVLSVQELGLVLVDAVEYVLAGCEPVKLQPMAQAVFSMIRPALNSDIDKYRERCVRNAANARSKSERVGASGCESVRVGANTTTTTTTTTKTTSTTTQSLSPAEIEERERWLIYGYFWSIGSNAIKEECSAFWSYYESLGWKNNKGAAIVSKLACARMWNRKFETKQAPNGADAWFRVMQNCSIADYSLFNAYMGAERTEAGAVVRLRVSEAWLGSFNEHCAGLLNDLAKLWRVPEITLERVP